MSKADSLINKLKKAKIELERLREPPVHYWLLTQKQADKLFPDGNYPPHIKII